jgi:hypothetical protein
MKLLKPAFALNAVASHDDPRALARSAEAVRVNWNRGSRRIIGDAQDRVALERPRIVRADR